MRVAMCHRHHHSACVSARRGETRGREREGEREGGGGRGASESAKEIGGGMEREGGCERENEKETMMA